MKKHEPKKSEEKKRLDNLMNMALDSKKNAAHPVFQTQPKKCFECQFELDEFGREEHSQACSKYPKTQPEWKDKLADLIDEEIECEEDKDGDCRMNEIMALVSSLLEQERKRNYGELHDKICQHCDGCSSERCAFSEGYHRGRKEERNRIKEMVSSFKENGECGYGCHNDFTLQKIINKLEE